MNAFDINQQARVNTHFCRYLFKDFIRINLKSIKGTFSSTLFTHYSLPHCKNLYSFFLKEKKTYILSLLRIQASIFFTYLILLRYMQPLYLNKMLYRIMSYWHIQFKEQRNIKYRVISMLKVTCISFGIFTCCFLILCRSHIHMHTHVPDLCHHEIHKFYRKVRKNYRQLGIIALLV